MMDDGCVPIVPYSRREVSVEWMMDDGCVPMALCSALSTYIRRKALCSRCGPCLDTTKNSYF